MISLGPLRVGNSVAVLYQPFDSDVSRLLVTSPLVRIDIVPAKTEA